MTERRGKKKHLDTSTQWSICIPESVATAVSEAVADPLTGKPRHGARAKLITILLRRWLAERQALEETIDNLNRSV